MDGPRTRSLGSRAKSRGRESKRRGSSTAPATQVWSIARDLAARAPSEFWENRNSILNSLPKPANPDADSFSRLVEAYKAQQRRVAATGDTKTPFHANVEGVPARCAFFGKLAELVGADLDALVFDAAARRAVVRRGNATTHDVLVVRFEDIADWENIVRDVVPAFKPAPAPVHAKGGDAQYARFKSAVASSTASDVYHDAACDTTRFYPTRRRRRRGKS